MLFFVMDGRILSDMERMNSVMSCIVASGIVDSTSCNDGYLCSILNVKIVVDNICHSGTGNNNRNVYRLSVRIFINIDINSLPVLFFADFDMLAVPVADGNSVFTQIEGSFLFESFPVNHTKYFLCNLIQHHLLAPSSFLYRCALIFQALWMADGFSCQIRQNLLCWSATCHLSAVNHHDTVRHLNNPFLMRDQKQTLLFLRMKLFKFFYHHSKPPKINPGLRFIKNAELMLFHKNRGNLDPLHLTSGKSRIHFPVQIFLRAEAYPAQ